MWNPKYGFDLGVLGYTLKINPVDTLEGAGPSTFSEYSTFYGGFNILVGRKFNIKSKEMMLAFGGGATYYFSFGQTTNYGIGIIFPDVGNVDVFSADINSPSTSILPFVKISAQLKLNLYLIVGMEYTHHFGSMLDGTYEFTIHHPPHRGISLYIQEH